METFITAYVIWIAIIWIGGSIMVAASGSERKIGFLIPLVVSLIMSPIIGFLMVLCDKDKQTDAVEKALLEYLTNKK